jgi:hypothetical protein
VVVEGRETRRMESCAFEEGLASEHEMRLCNKQNMILRVKLKKHRKKKIPSYLGHREDPGHRRVYRYVCVCM